MSCITDRIFIGNLSAANDLFAQREAGITAVLNVAFQYDVTFENVGWHEQFPVEYAKVGLTDGDRDTLHALFTAVNVLVHLLTRHARVLVNCHAGKSRSVSVVAVYVMAHEGWDWEKVRDYIAERRDGIGPAKGLEKAVKALRQSSRWHVLEDFVKRQPLGRDGWKP